MASLYEVVCEGATSHPEHGREDVLEQTHGQTDAHARGQIR